ncbi:MAG: IMPACT family protein [Thermanaeromonas sp.]|uniref:IMPACT family protein n=1 Tax=Thermanaeromonas sp. TaxID=2003697 RepID=UPI00243A54AD|nr:YigZ family protein [Thermanaeromonas sp.]MCG0277920.1 IMPACT family protein [Thermanaeromonas sp.]
MGALDSYTTVATEAEVEIKIERSVFLGWVREVGTEEEARSAVSERQRLHREATHNCFAYRLGLPPQEIVYYSDAGEPSGTAGRPILGAILSSGLTNVVVVVTRYFGGKKLGKRGLIEAYSEAARRALEKAGRVVKTITKQAELVCTYSGLDRILKFLHSCGGRVVAADYAEEVRITVEVPAGTWEEFCADIGPWVKAMHVL